jgi:mannosyltransferase OCH1-like enzyme
MIPKTIHYCWFGGNPKNDEILMCIESWKKTCPDFVICEWNEFNFPIKDSPFATKMYAEKKWAFVADYARLSILLKHGGFYLDTDMLLLQSLTPLTDSSCVLGEESDGIISAGMIGAEANHPFILECKKFYDEELQELITIPRALSSVFEKYTNKESLRVYPPKTFYPYDSNNIKKYKGQDLGKDVIGVHLWHYSWGHPLSKLLKNLGLYGISRKFFETLGIKKYVKRLLGFI